MNSTIKPKGDVELKNITYRYSDHRYVGRKVIKGKQILVYAKTQLECKKKLQAEINKVINKGIDSISKKKVITLINFWDKWFEQDKVPFISESTKKDIEHVKNKLTPIFDVPITKLNKDKILEFLNTLPTGRMKEKVIIYLKAMFKSAVNNEVIRKNPFDIIITPPRVFKKKMAFTYEQQVQLMEILKGTEIRPIILFYLVTGIRKNELNVNTLEKDIDVKRQIYKTVNEKGRHLQVRYKEIKVSEACIKMVFNNIDIFKKYTPETVYRTFKTLLEENNLKGSLVTCRHTFATNHFYLGTPELLISRWMGHSTSSITKDVYTDIDYDLSKEKILKLYNNLYYEN